MINMNLHRTFLLLFFLFAGCSQRAEVVIPGHIKNLNNLIVYPVVAEPAAMIRLTEEQAFGAAGDVLLGNT